MQILLSSLIVFIKENSEIIYFIISLLIMLIPFIFLGKALNKHEQGYKTPRNHKIMLVSLLIIVLIGIFFAAGTQDLTSIATILSPIFLALLIVVLQDIQALKSAKQLDNIHKLLLGDKQENIVEKVILLEEQNIKLQENIDTLINEQKLSNQQSREYIVNVTVKDKKSIVSVLDNFINKKGRVE